MALRFTSDRWGPLRSSAILLAVISALCTASDPEAAWKEAQSALKSGRYEAAEEGYRTFVKLQPNLGEGWANLGLALHLQKKRDAAIEAFERALKLNPGLAHAQLFLGINLFNANRTDEARNILEKYTAGSARDAQGHYYLGLAYATRGSLELAMRSLETAARLAPQDVDVLYHLAQNYLAQANQIVGRAAAAMPVLPIVTRWQQEHALQAIQSPPDESAEREQRQKLKALRPRLGRTPPDLDAEQHAAVALANLHLATAQRFYALEPDGFRIHQLLAGYYEHTSQREKAIAELKTVLKMNPNVRGVHLALGSIYKDSGQPDLALEQLKAELAIGSPDPAARLQLAQVYLMLERPENALTELKLIGHGDSQFYRTLGKTYTALGDFEQARTSYETAIAKGDRDRGTYYQLGHVYRRLGNAELARQAFAASSQSAQEQFARERARTERAIESQRREARK